MTVQCVSCKHYSLRDAGRMAKLGFGNCAHRPSHAFTSATYERDCRQHTILDVEDTNKRLAWLGEPTITAQGVAA